MTKGFKRTNFGGKRRQARRRLTAGTAKIRSAARLQNMRMSRTRSVANARTAGFLGIEKKFYDTMLLNAAIAAATDCTGGEYDPSATSMISTPAQGDTEQNRDGKRIRIKSVQVKGTITRGQQEDAIDPAGGDRVFIALVLDTQTNAAQMNSEDCFKNLSAGVTGNSVPMRNLLFGNRFRILKSQEFVMDYPTMGVEGNNLHSINGITRAFDWFVPLELDVNFNAGTTASVANVIDNSLHIIAYSQTAQPTLTYNARIRFLG